MNQVDIHLSSGKKLFFASDFHLGEKYYKDNKKREADVIRWLDSIRTEAAALFLVGDIFDFWFDYRTVVPRGYVRLLASIASFADAGIPVYYFKGNHDMWLHGYFEKELGCNIVDDLLEINCAGKKLLVGHGDGLGPGDPTYKLLKKVFRNGLSNFIFRWIHPDVGMRLATGWSNGSKKSNIDKDEAFKGEGEWLYQYCLDIEKNKHHDYYVFGHRHLQISLPVNASSHYYNLGEWMTQSGYGVFDEQGFRMESFER